MGKDDRQNGGQNGEAVGTVNDWTVGEGGWAQDESQDFFDDFANSDGIEQQGEEVIGGAEEFGGITDDDIDSLFGDDLGGGSATQPIQPQNSRQPSNTAASLVVVIVGLLIALLGVLMAALLMMVQV